MKSHLRLVVLLLFVALNNAAPAGSLSFPPSKDNTLYEDPKGQLSNGQGVYLFTGKTGEKKLRRGLIAFDLSAIPPNATITAATLSMFLSRTGPIGPINVSVSRMLRDWGEGASNAGEPGGIGIQAEPGDATWIHNFFDTSFWTTPGGEFSPTPSATTEVSKLDTTYTWTSERLLADVRSWISNPSGNFGWIILGNEIDSGSAARFGSRENPTNPPKLVVTFQAPAQALNISTRMRVETGSNVLIGGFIIAGNPSTGSGPSGAPKNIAVRGIGPSLTAFGISGVLADPTLELRDGSGAVLVQNDDWQDDPAQAAQLTALGLALQDPKESGIVDTLQPGAYTAILAGKNQTTGVGLVEIYDTNPAVNSQLADISTRGFVLTGNDVMIGGFILGGNGNTHVAVRGIGPSLAQFGLDPVLIDPTLELHDGNGMLLVANDDWQDDPVSASSLTFVGLALQDSKESGIYTSLPPGAFTAILAGKNDGTGIGLVEIYNLH